MFCSWARPGTKHSLRQQSNKKKTKQKTKQYEIQTKTKQKTKQSGTTQTNKNKFSIVFNPGLACGAPFADSPFSFAWARLRRANLSSFSSLVSFGAPAARRFLFCPFIFHCPSCPFSLGFPLGFGKPFSKKYIIFTDLKNFLSFGVLKKFF